MTEPETDIIVRAKARLGTWLKDKYRLDRVLGVGGMAVVYAATHRNQAEFAVKMLHRELSLNQDVKTRFLREGYAANSVKHRGAVRVVDDDTAEDDAAFLVMELLQGVVVEQLWEDSGRVLGGQIVAGIGYQLLDVLAAAHAKSVIHRDIKPANVFLTTEGIVKVLDFGIARLRDVALAGGKGTQTGLMMGTPAFMAPEQAMAKPADIDAQTDVWAVGATLFTLLSGQLVHQGDNAQQLMISAATRAVPRLQTAAPTVPAALADVIDRALAYEKADRWADAETMRDALSAACVTIYGEPPSRKRLALLLGDGGDSPESTRPFRSIPASSVRSATPESLPVPTGSNPSRPTSRAPGVGMQSTVVSDAVVPATARPSSYRPSTELTSTAGPDGAPPTRSRGGVRLLATVGAFAFVLAFGGGLALHAYKPSALPFGLVPPPPAVHASPGALAPSTAAAPNPGAAPGTSAAVVVPAPLPGSGAPAIASVAPAASLAPAAPSASAPPLASAEAAPESPSRPKHHPHHEPAAHPPAASAEPAKVDAPPPAGPDCSVPYTLDADGNKKWKMECLGH